MPRLARRHLEAQGVDPGATGEARELFAKKIAELLARRGWSQAELASQAGLGRDVINKYANAKILPTPGSLAKLAVAFNLPVEELYPWAELIDRGASRRTELPLVKMLPAADGNVHLEINMRMPMERALKVLALLQDD